MREEISWKGKQIWIEPAFLPYSYAAYCDGFDIWVFAGFGHSEEQAIERLIEQLEKAELEELCACDSDDPSVGYIGSTCAYCLGERKATAVAETRKEAA